MKIVKSERVPSSRGATYLVTLERPGDTDTDRATILVAMEIGAQKPQKALGVAWAVLGYIALAAEVGGCNQLHSEEVN